MLLRYQMPQEDEGFFTAKRTATEIFSAGAKIHSLFIWRHHMPMEVVMHFTERIATGRDFGNENCIIIVCHKPEIPDVAMSFSNAEM
ncbi:MAG: hypothetical protein ACLTNN_09875 [Blautia sp.]